MPRFRHVVRRSVVLGTFASLALVLGCREAPKPAPQPAVSTAATGSAVSSAATVPSPLASASAAPAPSAAPSPTEALIAAFAAAPSPGTRRSETVFGAGGVYAGLPPKWTTGDVYNQYLLAGDGKLDITAYLVTGTSLEPKALESFAKDAAYPIYLKDVTWEPEWIDVRVGPQGYTGRARRGEGRDIQQRDVRRAALLVGVEVPGRKTIHILGTWKLPATTSEPLFLDLVRGLGRCVHKPKRGCVPVAPTGEETELTTAPSAAPGSSPFG